MAYPTNIQWRSTSPGILGASPVAIATAQQGAGNGAQPSYVVSFQTDATQKLRLGTVSRFVDEVYGEIEAIYLAGVASTAAGDVVSYDPKAGTTTRAVAATRGPLAVALAPVLATQFGWYARKGQVPVNTTAAGTGAANSGLKVTATAGQATVAAGVTAGDVEGAICKSAQDAPGVGFTNVELSYPFAMV